MFDLLGQFGKMLGLGGSSRVYRDYDRDYGNWGHRDCGYGNNDCYHGHPPYYPNGQFGNRGQWGGLGGQLPPYVSEDLGRIPLPSRIPPTARMQIPTVDTNGDNVADAILHENTTVPPELAGRLGRDLFPIDTNNDGIDDAVLELTQPLAPEPALSAQPDNTGWGTSGREQPVPFERGVYGIQPMSHKDRVDIGHVDMASIDRSRVERELAEVNRARTGHVQIDRAAMNNGSGHPMATERWRQFARDYVEAPSFEAVAQGAQIRKLHGGKAVESIQEMLNLVDDAGLDKDGAYWDKTERAVIAFQMRMADAGLLRLTPENRGEVDTATLQLLFREVAAIPLRSIG